jgi:hypothetical protein
MRIISRWFWITLGALCASAAMAQAPEERRYLSQPELDQVLAPIALYPDQLLSQILTAATYPRDVAEAASWSRVHGLRGEDAVRAAGERDWDPSVTALVAFPEVLEMLDERRDWSGALGQAFLGQPDQVMDSVQELRRRADAAGTLRSSEEMVVQRQGPDYVIEPPTPDEVYVPYYDPREAYGTWQWPAYQPVYWAPWPGYSWGWGYHGLGWGPSVWIGGPFFYTYFDWGRRYVRYSHHRPWYHHHHHHGSNQWRGGTRWSRNNDRGSYDRRWAADRSGDRRWADRNNDRRVGDRNNDRRWTGNDRSKSEHPMTRASGDGSGFFRQPAAPAPVARNGAERLRTVPQIPAATVATPGARPQGRRYVAPEAVQPVPAAPRSAPVASHPAASHPAPVARSAPAPSARSESSPVARSAPSRESAPSRDSGSSRDSGTSSPASRGDRGVGRGR